MLKHLGIHSGPYVIWSILAGLVVLVGAVTVFLVYPGPFREQETIYVPIHFIDDFSDTGRIVDWGDNVFVGTVVEQEQTVRDQGGMPSTLFTVQVEENLKGTLGTEILVRQEGGLQKRWNYLYLMNGDPLLIPGETYLFVSRRDERQTWHTVATTYGTIQLETTERRLAVTRDFEEAITDE